MVVKLRTPITIQRPGTPTLNEANEVAEPVWVDVARSIMAQVIVKGGQEDLEAGKITGKRFYEITIRYSKSIDQYGETCRVRICGGPTVQLSAVYPPEYPRKWLVMVGTETKE